LGDDEVENFSKEVMSMYVNEALRGRDPTKKTNDSIRLQKCSEDGGVVSPKLAQMYERMAKVRASIVHDKIRVDPKMLTEAEEAKFKDNKDSESIIPNVGNLDIDLSRKFYYPDELWNSVKKGKKKHAGSKRLRQANMEKAYANKLAEEASYEMDYKSALTLNTEITSTDYDRMKGKEEKFSPLRNIARTINTDSYDDYGNEIGSASDSLINHLRNSIKRERESSLPPGHGQESLSSKFKIQSGYMSLASSPKLKLAKKPSYSSKTSLPIISPSKSVEKIGGLMISKLEGDASRSPKKKSQTTVLKEHHHQDFVSPKSKSIVEKLGTLETPRNLDSKYEISPLKMGKLDEKNSYRTSFDVTRVNSIMMDSQLSVNGRDYIMAQSLKEEEKTKRVGSVEFEVPDSGVRGWDKSSEDPFDMKKVKLPTIKNKKLLSSKHSMFRLKPSNEKFIQEYYLPKRNMMP